MAGEKENLSDHVEEKTLKIRAWSLPAAMFKRADPIVLTLLPILTSLDIDFCEMTMNIKALQEKHSRSAASNIPSPA